MFRFPNSDHVMFSREFVFCLFINYAHICLWMYVYKATFERNSSLGYNTWSEMGKQNTQGKKVYCFCDRYKRRAGQLLANLSSDPSNSPITLCES